MIVTTPPLLIRLTPSGGRFIWLFNSKLDSVARLSSRIEADEPCQDWTRWTVMRFLASEDLVAEPRRELRWARRMLPLEAVLFMRLRGGWLLSRVELVLLARLFMFLRSGMLRD